MNRCRLSCKCGRSPEWIRVPLPGEIADEPRTIDYGKQVTIGRKDMRVVLAISRRVAYTFARGQLVARTEATAPHQSLTPFVVIAGTRIKFVASS